MALDSLGPLLKLVELLQSLTDEDDEPAIQSVTIGPPTAIPARISAYVSLGDQDVTAQTGRKIIRTSSYYIGLVYRVDQDQQRAERGLCTIVDSIFTAVYADRTLGGTVGNLGIQNLPLTKEPKYTKFAGEEYRLFAIDLWAAQEHDCPAIPYTP